MMVYFVDEDIYIGGCPCRQIDLVPDQSVWLHVLQSGRSCKLYWQQQLPRAQGFAVAYYTSCCVMRYVGDVAQSTLLAQQNISYGEGYTVSVVREKNDTVVWLEGSRSMCCYLPPLDTATIDFSAALGVGVYGAVCQPRDAANPSYGVLLTLDGQVLWQGAGNDFALDGRWMTQCAYADMRAHTVRRYYVLRDGRLAIDEQMCQCTNAQSFISAVVPYLFVEALAVGDYDEARGYLSAPLAVQWNDVLAYMGGVAALDAPPYLLPDDQVACAGPNGEGKRFAFRVVDGKIDDICRVDV